MKKLLSFSFLLFLSPVFGQLINVKQLSSVATVGNNIMSATCNASPYSSNLFIAYGEMYGNRILMKINQLGDTVFAIKHSNSLFTPTEASDGSIYMSYPSDDSAFIIKMNSQGKFLWNRKVSLPAGGKWESGVSIAENTNLVQVMGSNYWASGLHLMFSKSDSSGARYVSKVVDMQSVFGVHYQTISPTVIRKTPGGNYVVIGVTYGDSGYPLYFFLVQFDPSGNLMWTKMYQTGTNGSTQDFNLADMNIASNGDILICGSKNSPHGTAFMRLDQNGNFLWAKNIADNSYTSQIIGLPNGNIGLNISQSNQVPDAVLKNMLVITDASGNVKKVRSFGGVGINGVCGFTSTTNKLLGAGYNYSTQEIYLYSMDTMGNSVGCYDVINSLPVNTWTISASSYTFTAVNDISSGTTNRSILQSQPLLFNKTNPDILTNGVITNPLCHGTFGNVNINPTGGSSPYNYKWSNGTTSQNLLNVPGGVYSVRLADNAGCVVIDTFNVTEPTVLVATYSVSNVTCYGSHNGSINVTTGGGTPGYDWQWTTQDTTEDLSNLSGGFYQLTITDANGCQKQLAVSVSEPQQLIAGILSSQNVKCHGACDGSLTGLASGGTAPYGYQWNNPGNSTTTSISNLCPGNYLFSVTDAHNCFTFANAVITEPAALSISSNSMGSLCGDSTGMANVTVNGGVGPYSYSWSNGVLNDTVQVMEPGTYTATVTDANNCIVSTAVNVAVTTPTPDMCLVTVDSLSTHNVLMWDKNSFRHTAYFNIYREDITNNYTLIGAVNYDSLSEYHDYDTLMADPNVTTKRYKISAVDSCGNESSKSNFHNTIFIAHNNGTFTWNTYTIQNNPNPVTNYLLMRDDLSNGNWQQIGSTAGTQNILNDPNYSTFSATASWRVETVWGISCTSTLRQGEGAQATVVKSKSNISNNRVAGINNISAHGLNMYPNPASEILNLVFEKAEASTIAIVNSLGSTVKLINSTDITTSIDISDLANGVYNVKLFSEGKQSSVRKLVIQK